jgi:hypothetical protein
MVVQQVFGFVFGLVVQVKAGYSLWCGGAGGGVSEPDPGLAIPFRPQYCGSVTTDQVALDPHDLPASCLLRPSGPSPHRHFAYYERTLLQGARLGTQLAQG